MNRRPRVVLFGTGSPLSLRAFDALADVADIAGVVLPQHPPLAGLRGLWRGLLTARAQRPFAARARRLKVDLWRDPGRREEPLLAGRIRQTRADLIVVASFPRLLGGNVLHAAPSGALGLHPSLLPRHRGPNPLFWTYVHDDRESGISLFRLDEAADTGALVDQQRLPLPRGRPVARLYEELSQLGAGLLRQCVAAAAAGSATATTQDEGLATREGRPQPGVVDLAHWGCERVWHVLSGLGAHFKRLIDAGGHAPAHGAALGFELCRPDRPAGTIEPHARGWRLYCRDGTVDVAKRVKRVPSIDLPGS